jgi:tetratricopeptide (TPR) repeat protein
MMMDAHPTFGSPSFKLVARGLLALHRLITEGKEDSPEADAVRDALDSPLRVLSRVEKERAQWLSEDLYSVGEPPAPDLREMTPQAQQQFYEALEAGQKREWDRALVLFRRCREFISPSLLSFLRGKVWAEAGYPDIASAFYGHASESDSTNAEYQASYMHSLAEVEPETARKLAQAVLTEVERHAPIVVAEAGHIRWRDAKTSSAAESARLLRDLIPILERNLGRIQQDEQTPGRESAYAATVMMLGSCHEFLGSAGAAVDYYTLGLQQEPNNETLLVARGVLLYGSSPRAITDFEQAVQLGSPVIWPYLFLAHHDLVTNKYDHCLTMCETGLRMRGSDTAKSQLEEWLAIARAQLGFRPEFVRAAFEAALRLDPSNELARRNRDAYEASLRLSHAILPSQWEQKSEAALREFGLAERRAA